MNVDEIIRKKREYGYTYEDLSAITGVPVSTIQKVLGKTTSAPRRSTLEALSRAFEPSVVREDPAEFGSTEGSSALAVPPGNNYTITDYLALPDDVRVELIDGVFYDMASPTFIHQRIAGAIHAIFDQFVDANGGPCIPMISPSDVQLDCDERTMVQPDVYVICDRDKITRPRIVGAPDMVIEILSPSNWYHDMVRKLRKYKNAGVREYWIVMPEQRRILVYVFEQSPDPEEYTFDDTVPVYIWDGKCTVDFRRIYEKVRFMLE
jgi:Uma2 family endonuclease